MSVEKKISEIISIFFHPMLTPTYVLILFLNISFFSGYRFSSDVKIYLVAFVFIMTFVIPALLMWVLKKMKVIETMHMNNRMERVVPLAMMAVVYYITYYSLKKIEIMDIFNLFLLGIIVVTLTTLLINLATKISLHMVSVGGVSGAMLGLLLNYPLDLRWVLYALIILSGVVGYARLTISNHTLRQVYNGFMLGFVLMLALFVL